MATQSKPTQSKGVKSLKPDEEKAVTHLSQIRFHKTLHLPADPSRSREKALRVTYADLDYRSSKSSDEPVIVLLPGLYGSRYMATCDLDALARKHKLQFLLVDKPGLGGSTAVPFEQRVTVYLNHVEELLDHLQIKHIALLSHSAGAIYLFNALIRMRKRLHPRAPYACFLAPWVHQKHTGRMRAASLVPAPIMRNSDSIIKFVGSKIAPKLAWSDPAFNWIAEQFPSKPAGATLPDDEAASSTNSMRFVTKTETDLPSSENVVEPIDSFDDTIDYSPDEPMLPGTTIVTTMQSYLFAEQTSGGAEDSMLCLKKGVQDAWGLMDDYDDAMDTIITNENKLKQHKANVQDSEVTEDTEGSADGKLAVQVFFAEDDYFIGEKGTTYLDALLKAKRDSSGAFIYKGEVVRGTQHESLVDGKNGSTMDKIFAHIKTTWK